MHSTVVFIYQKTILIPLFINITNFKNGDLNMKNRIKLRTIFSFILIASLALSISDINAGRGKPKTKGKQGKGRDTKRAKKTPRNTTKTKIEDDSSQKEITVKRRVRELSTETITLLNTYDNFLEQVNRQIDVGDGLNSEKLFEFIRTSLKIIKNIDIISHIRENEDLQATHEEINQTLIDILKLIENLCIPDTAKHYNLIIDLIFVLKNYPKYQKNAFRLLYSLVKKGFKPDRDVFEGVLQTTLLTENPIARDLSVLMVNFWCLEI